MRLRELTLLLVVVWSTACATNPVTGRREFMLVSPEKEAQLGAQAALQVEAEIGLYREIPRLTDYIERLGAQLAEKSPRQDVRYQFAVADMEEPNAFALPGGYVYVSRGLLVLANSEAELANVVGHEIGHVAARHSAQRQSQATGVGLLSVVGTLAAAALGGGEAAQVVNQVGQVAGAGLIATYGRGQEHQSDEVGQQIAASAGFSPEGMPRFLTTLQADSERRTGAGRMPSFFDSHPMTADRVEATAQRAEMLQMAPAAPIAGTRSAYLKRIDGMIVGSNPAQGIFEGRRFLHPGLDFAIDFPAGWQTQNQSNSVAAMDPNRRAVITLELQGPRGDPAAGAAAFARAQGLVLGNERDLRIHGLNAHRALTQADGSSGALGVELTWIDHPSGLFRITGLAEIGALGAYARVFEDTATSFRRLQGREAEIRAARLRSVRARAGETVASIQRRTGSIWSVEETAIVNGVAPDTLLEAGFEVKVAVRERLR